MSSATDTTEQIGHDGTVICGGCGAENRAGARFCSSCGVSLDACPSCGADRVPDARFCDRCGTDLGVADESTGHGAGDEGHVPSGEATTPERRSVTVLFADAKGSTSLTERIGDEGMYRLMQKCVESMQEIVERHDGTVTQFRGDGIMALFGAPVATEDAAAKAVSAGLDIQVALQARIAELQSEGIEGCAFRVGLNTGPVVVGRMGDETLVDYTAIGDTANVAARMEQAAGPGQVYVSEATWRAVRDFVECEPVGPLDLAGKQHPVDTYRAVRRRLVASRFDAAAMRGLSPFVGRETELSLLNDLVARLDDGHGRVVCLVGEPGIGKSRLVRELREALPANVRAARGRSSSSDRAAPWHLVVDVLRNLLSITDDQSPEKIAASVDELVAGSPALFDGLGDHLRWLLGIGADTLEVVDPMERRAGNIEALTAVVHAVATVSPTVLVFEDLHWADEASLAATRALVNAVSDAPVLLLATYRPDAPPDLGDRPWVTILTLEALGGDAATELAASAVRRPLSPGARDLIVGHCGGNPLFIEELTVSLLESGVLVEGDELVDVTRGTDAADLPASVHDVVLTRIDQLDAEARNALQLAAVIGREFTHRILDRIASTTDDLDGHIAELEALELIRQRAWFPELAYLFKHAIVHDVTYSTLLDERRRKLHAVVARATEELYADQLGDHCDSLARHWLEAGEPHRALPHLAAAGERALAGLSATRAAAVFAQAADVVEGDGLVGDAIAYRTRRIEALHLNGRYADAVDESNRVIGSADRSGDVAAESIGYSWLSLSFLQLHEFEHALDASDSGLGLAWSLGEEGHDAQARNLATSLSVKWVIGQPDDDREAAFRAVVSEAGSGGQDAWDMFEIMTANWRAAWDPRWLRAFVDAPLSWDVSQGLMAEWFACIHTASVGDYLSAITRLEVLMGHARRLGFLYGLGRYLNTIAWIHGELGDHDVATRLNRESIDAALELQAPDREIEANARLNIADDALARGDLATAEQELASLEPTVRSPAPQDRFMLWRWTMRWWCSHGRLALASGNTSTARAAAGECLETAVRVGARKYEVRGRRLLGRAFAAEGDETGAIQELDAALAIAREIGNPPQLWRTLMARATVGDDGEGFAIEAVETIDGVVDSLGDHALATTLRGSPEREAAQALAGAGRTE